MKKILLIFILIASFLTGFSQATWTPINGRQRFVSGLGIPVRDSSYYNLPTDTAFIFINYHDSLPYYKYKSWIRPLGGSGGITGSGITNQVAYWNGTSSLSGSNNFTWDPVNNQMLFTLGLAGYIKYGQSGWNSGFVQTAYSNFIFGSNVKYNGTNWLYDQSGYGSQFQAESFTGNAMINTSVLGTAGGTATMIPRFQVLNAGRILMGTTLPTDDGTSGLQVNGAIRQSSVTNSLLKAGSTGIITSATSGTDYQVPITLTTTGGSGAATLVGSTLNIPIYTGGGGGSVSNVAALTLGTTGTDLNSSVSNPTTTPVITLNVPDASGTARGVITTGTQTIAGAKTFTTAPTVYDSANHTTFLSVYNPFNGASSRSGLFVSTASGVTGYPSLVYGQFTAYPSNYAGNDINRDLAGKVFIQSGGDASGILNFFDGTGGWQVSSGKADGSSNLGLTHFTNDIYVPHASYYHTTSSPGVGFGTANPNILMSLDSVSVGYTFQGASTVRHESVDTGTITNGKLIYENIGYAAHNPLNQLAKFSYYAMGSLKNSGQFNLGTFATGVYGDGIIIDTFHRVRIPTMAAGTAGTDSVVVSNNGVLRKISPTYYGTGGGVSTISFGTTGLTPNTATGGVITVAGTLAVANGGTGSATQNFVDLSTTQSVAGGKTFSNNTTFTATSQAVSLSPSTNTSGAYVNAQNLSGRAIFGVESSVGNVILNGGTAYATGIGSITNFPLQFGANGILGMTLNTSNQLGIGTTTIGSALQVNGAVAIGYSASTVAATNGLRVSGTVTFDNLATNGLVKTSGGTGLLSVATAGTDYLTPTTGVTTFSGSTTGLTPATATSGAITLAGTLIAGNGGTGQSTYAIGDLLSANTTTTLSKVADVAAGQPLLSGGVSTLPAYAGYTFSGTAAQTYTFPTTSKTLAANDGSNLTIASQAIGDILTATSTTAYSRLADAATGNALISGGAGVAPSYGKIGLTTHVSGTLATANGGTNLTTFTSGGALYATSTSALTTGTLPIASGGTGSATQNFVDLSTTQTSIGGQKTFTSNTFYTVNGQAIGLSPITTTNATFINMQNLSGRGIFGIEGSTPGTIITGATAYAFGITTIGAAVPIQFGINSQLAMTLNTSSNLGIGTATIGSKLQVNGGAAIGYSASTVAATNGLRVAGTVTLDNLTTAGVVTTSSAGLLSSIAALTVPNGGTGLTTLTSNVIYKGNGTTALAVSSLSDNGTTVSTTEAISSGAITSTGASVFGGLRVQGTGAYTAGTSNFQAGISSSASLATVVPTARFDNNGNGFITRILMSDDNLNDANIFFTPSATTASNLFQIAVAGVTPQFTIDGTGAATHTSSVTASSFIKSGGTSTQGLMADGSVQTLTSGTYTPTMTGVANISVITPTQAVWSQVGNIVTVSGSYSYSLTSATTTTTFGISLPVASASLTASDLWGLIFNADSGGGFAGGSGYVVGDATNKRATVDFKSTATTTGGGNFQFQYFVH
jgi:hypothetical protein